jgi:hypothetical protein
MSGVALTGSYHLLRQLGARTHATHAATRGAQELVVVQRFTRDETTSETSETTDIAREARALAKNWHSNVARVKYVDPGTDLVVATELIDGITLADLLALSEPLPPEKTNPLPSPMFVRVMLDVLAGLQHFHSLRDEANAERRLDAVHGAVCPTNIVIGKDGVARLVACFRPRRGEGAKLDASSESLAYSAPEVRETEALRAAGDLYACGVMLWEGLQGKPLFSTTPLELSTLRQRQREEDIGWDADAASLGARLGAVVLRALAFDPALRFRTAQELATAIRRSAGNEIATASRVGQHVVELAGDRIRARRAELVKQIGAAAQRAAPRGSAASPPTQATPAQAMPRSSALRADGPPAAEPPATRAAKPPPPKPPVPKPTAARPAPSPAKVETKPTPPAPFSPAKVETKPTPPPAPVAFEERPTPTPVPVAIEAKPTPVPTPTAPMMVAASREVPQAPTTPEPVVRDMNREPKLEPSPGLPVLQRGIPVARAAQIVAAAVVITLLLIFLVVKTRPTSTPLEEVRVTSSKSSPPQRREASSQRATPITPDLPPPAPEETSASVHAQGEGPAWIPALNAGDAGVALPDPTVAVPAPTAPPKKSSYDPQGI